MINLDDVLDIFFEMLKNCIESITLPTGHNLVPTFLYSLVILSASAASTIFANITLVDWRGALIATILLLGLALIERRGVNEISRLYRTVKSGATSIKERTARPGAALEAQRNTNPGDDLLEEDGGLAFREGEM